MSASDAAPLPRLGEVFFDVRGSSRSMRLSWYADTGVAVFSIWQGGMCTGTFRLPIGDLPRMIEILQQGPDGDGRRPRAGHQVEQAWGGREPARTGRRDVPPEDLGYQDAGGRYRDEPRTGYSQADVETSAASYAADELTRPRGDRVRPPHGPGYGQPGGDAEYYGGEPNYAGERDYGSGEPGYGAVGGVGYGADYSLPGEPGYSQERFVPPYVRGAVGEYGSDIPARPAGRQEDPIRGAYRSDPVPDPSQADDYQRRPWPETGYSDDPQYRLADEGSRPGGSGSGRHSPGRYGNYPAEPGPADPQYQTGLPGDIDELTHDYPAWRPR